MSRSVPEWQGKTDDEVIDYIKGNAYEMEPIDGDSYDSLGEELADQDIVREKVPHIDSEIWAEVSDDSEEDDEDEEDDDEE